MRNLFRKRGTYCPGNAGHHKLEVLLSVDGLRNCAPCVIRGTTMLISEPENTVLLTRERAFPGKLATRVATAWLSDKGN